MIEVYDNLWTFKSDYKIIATNGTLKQNGRLVMGRGVALQAKKLYIDIDKELGSLIQSCGNHINVLNKYKIISFPTKHNWWEKSNLKLIERSTDELCEIIKFMPDKTFALPRVGCGNGHLSWNDVKPILMELPDNCYVVSILNE